MPATIDWGYDAARDPGGFSFTLTETGGGGATGTVTLSGQYFHSAISAYSYEYDDVITGERVATGSTDYIDLSSALKTAMEAVGAATYSVAFDASVGRYTITASGGGVTAFSMTSMTHSARMLLGMTNGPSTALARTSSFDVWHWTFGTIGGWSDWTMRDADPESSQLVGADGTVRGLSPIGVPRLLDFSAPLEPIAKVWSADAGLVGWCYQRAFMRARSVEPIVVSDMSDGLGYRYVIGYLRHDACVLRPILMSADYLAYQTVPISMVVIGEVYP